MTPAVCYTIARKEKRSLCCGSKKARDHKCFSLLASSACKIAYEHFRHEVIQRRSDSFHNDTDT
jgi:hypothetical protein